MGHKAGRREKKRAKKARRASLDARATAIDLTDLASPIPEPPPLQAATRTQSGFAPRMPDPPRVDDETLSEALVSLQPLYRVTDAQRGERAAELDVQDLSLRPSSPYLASPLTSMPPAGMRSWSKQLARGLAIALLAASSGYGVWSAVRDLRAYQAEPVGVASGAP